MTPRGLQWLAIALPALLVGAFEFLRHRWLDHQLPGPWGNMVGTLLVAAATYGFIRYFTGAVTRSEQELGRSRAEAAVLAERHRIAREMHDSVAQTLFHVRVRLQEMARLLPGDHGTEMERLQTLVGSAYDGVRAVVADLKRNPVQEDAGEALRRAVVTAAGNLGLQAAVDVRQLPALEAVAQQHLAAVVTEALTNARRHGKATAVTVHGDLSGVTVTDNGNGFDPNAVGGSASDRERGLAGPGGFGLMIMSERARMVGGHLQVESQQGRGTSVKLLWKGREHDGEGSDRR